MPGQFNILKPYWSSKIVFLSLSIVLGLCSQGKAGSLLVSWDPLQNPALGGYRIRYGTSSGSYGQTVDVGRVTSFTLQNLGEGTRYYIVVVGYDANRLDGYPSGEVSGVVLQVSSVASSSINHNSAVVNWQTNKPSDSQVEYGTTVAYGTSTPLNSISVSSHSLSLNNLNPSATYHYRVRSMDAGGGSTLSGDYTFSTLASPDTIPPVISSVASSALTTTSATINWSTDEESDSQVEFGLTSALGGLSPLQASMTKNHQASLSNLESGKVYSYRVLSKDSSGNQALSGVSTFETLNPSDSTPPGDVVNLSAVALDRSVVLNWTTPTDSDYSGVVIRYRMDGIYPASQNDGLLAAELPGTPNTAQSFTHAALTNDTTYHYSVFTYDSSRNYSSTAHVQATPIAGLALQSLSPTQGRVSSTVVIAGTGFGDAQGSSTVTVSGLNASVSKWSKTSISFSVPSQATTGPVIVSIGGKQSNGLQFKVTAKLAPPKGVRIKQ